ncbi:MAG TPA: VOC family protein, partial [Vicinamibacteria bacterium]|nr:VOC family protein [Vicinamibacteria bacterium]
MTHARYALDHVFVCCAEGAPEAQRLARLGLSEGSFNTHPGQGTASRRFFFANAYLELFWVADAREARSALAAPTRLWPRWSARGAEASPFAIILRPDDGGNAAPPFASW